MTRRNALVAHHRMPAFDRDSGSQDIDNTIRYLLDDGWTVSFMSREDEQAAEARHADRLRRMGVATFAGFDWAPKLLRSTPFDLVVVSYWEVAAEVLPLVRDYSPDTRVVVNSMDVHFLRHARQTFLKSTNLGDDYGADAVGELNVYNAADAVIAVSEKERALLGDFLGDDRVFTVPLAEHIERSAVPLADRRGMLFVGNFRHVPNREAAQYLCREIIPLLDPELLERHPLTIVGNWLDRAGLRLDEGQPGVHVVGWVPQLQPYVERARLSVVPLLSGAGVKRKVLQSMMAYTPVVTTNVGAEGLDLDQGVHALIASDAGDMASGLTRLLTDDDLWENLAVAGADHVDGRHGFDTVRRHFGATIETVMSRPRRVLVDADDDTVDQGPDTADAEALRRRIQMIAEPGAPVLVVTLGDDDLVDLGSQPCWHFPEHRDTGWAGFDPVDGPAAISHLEAQRVRGARYFVLPAPAFSWRTRYPELHDHLESTSRRVHQDDHLVVYDLAPDVDVVELDPTPAATVHVFGSYSADRTGPPADMLRELESSEVLSVRQVWHPATGAARVAPDDTGADYVVLVDDNAVLPKGFLDELLATQVTLDVDRLQPAHTSGPASGPPITERHRGVVAREVDALTPSPVVSVRAGARLDGPVTLADDVTVGLREPVSAADADDYATVRRVWTLDRDRRPEVRVRAEPDSPPRISVLVSTYNRGLLLRECLESFAEQTIDRAEFEVVVVDDGSEHSIVDELVDEFSERLQIFGVRIGHAGRSAAKNHAVLLARAPIVLFFDDDDRATPDYLERHLAGHDARPDDGVAILGHTDWAPELEISPLMHFITDVDRLMFSYGSLSDGQELDWKGFWEGRISCKRSLLLRHGLHDQRLDYSIDIEMGWRLMPHGLRVIYDASATSVMARPLDFEGFCTRTQAKGKAMAVIAALHRGADIAGQLKLEHAAAYYDDHRFDEETLRRRVAGLEAVAATGGADEVDLDELHDAYRLTFRLLNAKGVAETTGGVYAMSREPNTAQPFPIDPPLVHDGTPPDASDEPVLTVTLPVWSRSPELAEMAKATIERIWEVARVPTEVVAIDNGSDYEVPLAAKVYRYSENKGVSIGWNTGVRLATAPVVVVMNSDCRVEPGWDEALLEAATDGRRVAFPYTDHCDGHGFTSPDQGGTAGWCFMLTKEIYEEVGVFDEWFSPAFCEDTDYWHRAWQMGIELTPVPAARVTHARRTTASTHPHVDWLLQGHRYKYGWKHGVDPHAAPPYYNRKIVEYHGSFEAPEGDSHGER